MRIFLFGAGYSAQTFARRMTGEVERIAGTTRDERNFPKLEQSGIAPLLFGDEGTSPDLPDQLARSTHVVVSISPGENGDPALALVEEALGHPDNTIRWIGYLSTVGVYGDHQGEWVDETASCKPVSRRSRERLEAEEAWRHLTENTRRRWRSCACPAFTVRAAMLSSIWNAARRGASSRRARFSTASMSMTLRAPCAFFRAPIAAASSTSPTTSLRRRRMSSLTRRN